MNWELVTEIRTTKLIPQLSLNNWPCILICGHWMTPMKQFYKMSLIFKYFKKKQTTLITYFNTFCHKTALKLAISMENLQCFVSLRGWSPLFVVVVVVVVFSLDHLGDFRETFTKRRKFWVAPINPFTSKVEWHSPFHGCPPPPTLLTPQWHKGSKEHSSLIIKQIGQLKK